MKLVNHNIFMERIELPQYGLNKRHGGIFSEIFFLRLDTNYIYIWIVLEVLYTQIYIL